MEDDRSAAASSNKAEFVETGQACKPSQIHDVIDSSAAVDRKLADEICAISQAGVLVTGQSGSPYQAVASEV